MLNCITVGKKIPTEIVSNLILAYSVMAKGAIIKMRFLFLPARGDFAPAAAGSIAQETGVRLKSKLCLYCVLCS